MFMLKLGDEFKNLIKTEVKSVFKSVKNIRLKAGQSLVDIDISKANLIVIHYEINNLEYRKSMVIPKGNTTWYTDSANNATIFFRVINWNLGNFEISSYSTVLDNVAVVGYDLIY